jgi:hypothetical protein
VSEPEADISTRAGRKSSRRKQAMSGGEDESKSEWHCTRVNAFSKSEFVEMFVGVTYTSFSYTISLICFFPAFSIVAMFFVMIKFMAIMVSHYAI